MFGFLSRLLGKKKTQKEILVFAEAVRNKHLQDLILQAYLQRKITNLVNPAKEGMERRTGRKEGYYSVDEIWIKGKVFARVEVWIEGEKVKAKKYFPKFEMKEEPVNK